MPLSCRLLVPDARLCQVLLDAFALRIAVGDHVLGIGLTRVRGDLQPVRRRAGVTGAAGLRELPRRIGIALLRRAPEQRGRLALLARLARESARLLELSERIPRFGRARDPLRSLGLVADSGELARDQHLGVRVAAFGRGLDPAVGAL